MIHSVNCVFKHIILPQNYSQKYQFYNFTNDALLSEIFKIQNRQQPIGKKSIFDSLSLLIQIAYIHSNRIGVIFRFKKIKQKIIILLIKQIKPNYSLVVINKLSKQFYRLKMQGIQESSPKTKISIDLKSPRKYDSSSRLSRLKQIDAIYKSQIQQIYTGTTKLSSSAKNDDYQNSQRTKSRKRQSQIISKVHKFNGRNIDDVENVSTSSRALHSVMSQQKMKFTKMQPNESSRTIQLLRMQNQNKDIKTRQLTNKCTYLMQKLKKYLNANQYAQQIQVLSRITDNKMQRFQNLYKIKNEQAFFKMKLQTMALLQQFQISKEQLIDLNQIQTEAAMFTYMTKKIKNQLKNLRIKQQQTNFEIKKDRILNQKYQQRIHHLTQTSQLLKMSQSKLKTKNEDLKKQLKQYIQKLKQRQLIMQQKQSEIFRLKKQHQQAIGQNNRLQALQRKISIQKQQATQFFQLKEKQLKNSLSTCLIEKQKFQKQIEEKQNYIQEILIKRKYVQQQNERLNRELLRLKQRYEWYQKQLQQKQRQFEQQKIQLIDDFNRYKSYNNPTILLSSKSQTQQALRRIEQYQQAYSNLSNQLQQQKRIGHQKHQLHLNQIESIQMQWIQKTKRLQAIRQQEMFQIAKEYEEKHCETRKQFQSKEKLIAEEMQSRVKNILLEKDKKIIQKVLQMEQQNDELKRQISSLKQLINQFSIKT